MRARPRSWWKNTSKTLKIVQIIGLIVVVGLIVSLIGGYFFNWTWTGFGPYTPPTSNFQREKTLYDWLQLAIIPLVLTFGVWWLTRLQQQRDQQLADRRATSEQEAAEKRAQTEREISLDNQQEAALQLFIDKMSELLLHENLCESTEDDEVRKASLWIADLSHADLSHADLSGADLNGATLIGTILINAQLQKADLSGPLLRGANLRLANLHEADLRDTDLSGADLSGVQGITIEELEKKARSLQGATMPDEPINP